MKARSSEQRAKHSRARHCESVTVSSAQFREFSGDDGVEHCARQYAQLNETYARALARCKKARAVFENAVASRRPDYEGHHRRVADAFFRARVEWFMFRGEWLRVTTRAWTNNVRTGRSFFFLEGMFCALVALGDGGRG